MLLAGDVGGTKTALAIYSYEFDLIDQTSYPSRDYNSLDDLLRDFMQDTAYNIETATFGVAGPVSHGVAQITNLGWTIKESSLKDTLGFEAVKLLNDLEAYSFGVPFLTDDDVVTIKEGQPVTNGNIGVLAPGTGLGEGFLTWDGERYRAHASEGGHTDFAPINAEQIGLLQYLMQHYEHVSAERICSGMGIPNIYAYFREINDAQEPQWLQEKLAATDDPTPLIINAAMDDTMDSPLCDATLDTFISVMGAEAGNLAITVLSTAGMYLGGGIPPRILDRLRDGAFIQSFIRKGRLSPLLKDMPVYVITNKQTPLIGSAHYARLLLG